VVVAGKARGCFFGSQVLLPGITTLARMVAEVRQEENDRLYATLYRATPHELRTEMARLLEVPEKRRVSELERLRLGPMRISGRAMEYALERTQQVRDLGAGKVDVAQVPAARLTVLARYGLTSKAPTLKRLEVTRHGGLQVAHGGQQGREGGAARAAGRRAGGHRRDGAR